MISRPALSGSLALAVWFAAAMSASAVTVDIVEYGIYAVEIERTERRPDGVDQNILGNICHVATTTTVPAKRGVHFGFRYRVGGGQTGQSVDLVKVVRFPEIAHPPGGPRPLAGIERPEQRPVGARVYTGYSFDDDWEIMPGRWTFEIWSGGQRLTGMNFDVVEGAPVPSGTRGDCFRVSSLWVVK